MFGNVNKRENNIQILNLSIYTKNNLEQPNNIFCNFEMRIVTKLKKDKEG